MDLEELAQITSEEQTANQQYDQHIHVCVAAGCLSSNSDRIKAALEEEVKAQGRSEHCCVKGVGCMGLCGNGPLVSVEKEQQTVLYQGVQPDDATEIVESLDGKPVSRLECPIDMPFFTRQKKIVLENFGRIDPERIEDYIAAGGYRSLLRALTELMPVGIVNEITRSGLRGRGGAGYPTGLKMSTVAKAIGSPKYVVCNGDEGDPGAFMDRSVMESDPHRVIEGMAIAAYAVGASQGYIYVRGEYPLAITRLRNAIRQAQKRDLLGNNIGGTGFNFDISLRLGAGAFVCGEETALLASVEGNRGTPRPRPPYPAQHGLWDKPTLINNVETFANIPTILHNGSEWFAEIGTDKSKGTKVFALSGKIRNVGLIEVPMGISLEEIVYDIGGGIPDGKAFKAVQTGGPSGGCIPEEYLNTPVSYESLAELGSIMGSGGMIIVDEDSSMVDVARYFMEFCMSESCGKCIPCRVGTAEMYDLLTVIARGEGSSRELEQLEDLCAMVRDTSLCGLGQSSPNPVLSTLRYFKEEYLQRLTDHERVTQ